MTEPVLLNQLDYTKRWTKNWGNRYQSLAQAGLADDDNWRNLAKFDLQRVQKGQQPLSDREAALGLLALQSGQQVIPEPESRGPMDWLIKNPLEDLRDILTGLPQLPAALVNEVRQLPEAPEKIGQALSQRDTGDRLEALTAAPGIRLVPGAFTVHNIAAGTPEVLAEHPISTFLDVLPYAEKAGLTAAAKKALSPVTERYTRFFTERGLGGEEGQETMRQISQAQRGMSDALVEQQRLVLAKMDELGLPNEERDAAARWMQRDRGLVPPKDPRWEELAQFQQKINDQTGDLAMSTEDLIFFEGEYYPANSKFGKELQSRNKAINGILERFDSVYNKERHWSERVANDEARLNSLLEAGIDTPTLSTMLADLGRTWSVERAPQILSQLETGLPVEPGGPPLPLRPGEVAWGEGLRHDASTPTTRQVLPASFKDVRIQDGVLRSGALDTLDAELRRINEEILRNQGGYQVARSKLEFLEPAQKRLLADIESTKQRIAASEARRESPQLAAELEKARTIRLGVEPRPGTPDPLIDQLVRARNGMSGEARARFEGLLGELDDTHSAATAQAVLDELNNRTQFVGGQAQGAARSAAESLRVRLSEAKGAEAGLKRLGYMDDETLAAARESLARDEARVAEHDTLRQQLSDHLDADTKLKAERAKLGRAFGKESERLGKVGKRVKIEKALTPEEDQLRRAYGAIDDYEAGDKTLDYTIGPSERGLKAIDNIRAIAQRLEEEGWTAPPSPKKLKAMRASTREATAYGRVPGVKARTVAGRALDRLFGDYGLVYQVQGSVLAGDVAEARRVLSIAKSEARRLAKVVPEAQELVDRLQQVGTDIPRVPRTARQVENATARLERSREGLGKHTSKIQELTTELESQSQKRAKLVGRVAPARYQPHIERQVREHIYNELNPTRDPELGVKLQLGSWKDTMSQADIDAIYSSYEKHWMELREQGLDPVFMHHVPPSRARQVTRTSLALDHEPDPTQTRLRVLDMADHIDAPEVAMTHQLMEWEQRHWTENFMFGGDGMPGITNNKDVGGRAWTNEQVVDKYAEEIVNFANKKGISLEQARDRFISRHFTVLKPFSFVNWSPSARIKALGRTVELKRVNGEVIQAPTEVLVPKAVEKVITGMIPKKGGPGFAYQAYDKALNVFRISALGFSPRFQVYNTLGGAIMLLARTDPGVFKFWRQAREMVGGFGDFVRRGEPPPGMPLGISRGQAVVPEFATRLRTDPVAGIRVEQGKFLGKLWNGIQKAAEKSFSANEWVDNMYRSMAYLYGQDKAITKGLSKADAVEAGLKLSNKILQDWDAMLPWERTVLRNVLPFYGWMKHIAKYTFTYPFDHPLRASILSSMVRTEIEDQKSGLPEKFRQILWLGEPDAEGRQLTVNLAGVNPFADVADMFTLAGFISQVSPAGQSVLEMMGVDLANARSSLFPDTTYDPETGRLVAQGKSPIESLITSFVPQTEAAYALGGLSPDMRLLYQRDPDAWKSRIFNSVGIPFSPRRRSRTEEEVRAELARDQAAADSLRKAIRTGQWGDALRYPIALIDFNNDGQVEPIVPAEMKQLFDTVQAG